MNSKNRKTPDFRREEATSLQEEEGESDNAVLPASSKGGYRNCCVAARHEGALAAVKAVETGYDELR